MSTIDEKFEKLIAEKKATEAVAEEASEPTTEVSEDAATGNTAITGGAVPQQKSDLKNDAIEVGGSSKEKPEGPDNVGKKAAASCRSRERQDLEDETIWCIIINAWCFISTKNL